MNRYQRVSFLIGLLLTGACTGAMPTPTNPAGDVAATASAIPAAGYTDTATAMPEDTDWKEYVSRTFGFSLRYPGDLQPIEQPSVPGIPLWIGFSDPDDPGDFSRYEPYFGLIVYANPEHLPLIDWFSAHMGDAQERGQPKTEGIVFYSPIIENHDLFQGRPALQYESGAWPIRYEKLVNQDSWIISLYYHRDHPVDYGPLYEQVLDSLELFAPVATLTATKTPASPTPSPTVCLDEQALPLDQPEKQGSFEVRFISDGDIWVWEETEGPARQISNTGDALRFNISPNGKVIAFERPVGDYPYGQYKVELWAIDRDGEHLRRLVSARQFDGFLSERHEAWVANLPRDYRWLPGISQLAFGVYPSVNAVGGSDAAQGYWVVDLDTLEVEEWKVPEIIDPYAAIRLPSPDGEKVALVDRMSISLLNADLSIIHKDILTYTMNTCGEGPCWGAPPVVWAPDSQSLHAVVWDEDPFGDSFSTWQIPANGLPARKLHSFTGMAFSTSISPNQKYLAYLRRMQPMSNQHELHLANLDGSKDIIYATGYQLQFQGWAPDSVHFIYDQFNIHQPFLGSVCGGAQPLLNPIETPATRFTWVDSNRFLFVSGREGQPRHLRLGQLGGMIILIGPFNGEGAYYEVRQVDEVPGMEK